MKKKIAEKKMKSLMKSLMPRRKFVSLKGPEPWLLVLAEHVRRLMCSTMIRTEDIASELECSLKSVFRAVALLRSRGDMEFIRCVGFRRGGVVKMRGALRLLKKDGLSPQAIADRLHIPLELVESGLKMDVPKVEDAAAETNVPEEPCSLRRETFDELWEEWIQETQLERQVLEWTADGM